MHCVLQGRLLCRTLPLSVLFTSLNPHRSYVALAPSISRPDLRLGYLLNLSILVSRGIENKYDSPSNGERTGKSSCLKSGRMS